jgi:malate synthase
VLADPAQWAGRAGANILLRHNGLHIELVIDPAHPSARPTVRTLPISWWKRR